MRPSEQKATTLVVRRPFDFVQYHLCRRAQVTVQCAPVHCTASKYILQEGCHFDFVQYHLCRRAQVTVPSAHESKCTVSNYRYIL